MTDFSFPPSVQQPEAIPTANEELSVFVGRNADRYLEQWTGLIGGRSNLAGFNWSAFLAQVAWFAYRKMYFEALLLFVASQVVGLIAGLLAARLPLAPSNAPLVSLVLLTFFWVLAGFAANPLYYRRATRVVAELAETQPASRQFALDHVGGVSPGSAIAVVVATIAFSSLMALHASAA